MEPSIPSPIAAGILAGLCLAASGSSSLMAQSAPDQVSLSQVSYTGTGCAPQSARAVISPDKQAVTLIFDSYIAVMDPRGRPQDRRRDCAITLTMSFSEGWQYTVLAVDYRGFAALDSGAWGQQLSRYRFRGGQFLPPSQARINGSFFGDYQRNDESGRRPRGWSPCRRQVDLEIETSMQVGGRQGATAYMSIDSIDGEVRESAQRYALQWRRCS